MKKILLVGLTSILLSGCQVVVDFGSKTSSSTNKVSSSSQITSSNKEKGLTGVEYLEYYSKVTNTAYFPSSGNPTMLVVPVLFEGANTSGMMKDIDQIHNDIEIAFNGSSEEVGFESVRTYYEKSSYGKLNLEMDVYEDWIVLDKTFDEFVAIEEEQHINPTWYAVDYVVEYLKNQGLDMTQYDSNSDGFIDGVWLVYGERNYRGMSNPSDKLKELFWAFTYWKNRNYPVVGDPKANIYCWASYDFMYDQTVEGSPLKINTHIYIHETGHMIGLEDYYDYDNSNRLHPAGCLDMMDYNIGDHNAYSKFFLGWIEPQVFSYEESSYTLRPFESSGDALLIPSSLLNKYSPLDEYLLLEYYTPTGLNELDSKFSLVSGYPKLFNQSGIKIYHVDARMGEMIYEYGNWTHRNYINNFSKNDLYSCTQGYNYFKIFASNTGSLSVNQDFKLLSLVSQFYGQGHLYNGKYATNRDLFQTDQYLDGFKFNSGSNLDFEIYIEALGEDAKIYLY